MRLLARLTAIILAVAGALACPAAAPAAEPRAFPTQPIRLIVPFAPGGGMESAVRMVVQKINESGWPQLIVDNRPGGTGTIAALATKQAAPDGYVLMLVALSTHAINPVLMPDLKYDPLKDFTPITLLFSYPSVVAVPAASPAKTLDDLVQMARTKPGGLSYASPGRGTVAHILALMLESATGTSMVHVPARGGGPALLDVLAGRVDFIALNPSAIVPNVQSGQLRLLAVTSKTRLSGLPDVPTMAELGYPQVFLDGWFGIAGPAGMADELAETINGKFAEALRAPDLDRRLKEQGWIVDSIAPREFRNLIERDIARLRAVLAGTDPAHSQIPNERQP
jgi:tripartite-type tricarboxylate transporter receptor subunit TctC